jgi:hypothetical protein
MKLPRPRFTVRRMMIAVAVVAVNFGLIRGTKELKDARGAHDNGLLLFAAYTMIPALSLLTVAAVDVGFGLLRCGKTRSFSTGYLLLGGLVSFGICFDLATQSFVLDAVTVTITDDRPDPTSLLGKWSADMMLIFVFALPQVIVAMIGGGLADRYGLMIVRNVRAMPDAAAISVTDEVSTRGYRTDP